MSEISKKRVKDLIDRESDKLKTGGKTKFNPTWIETLKKVVGSSDAYAEIIKESFNINDDIYKLIERRISQSQISVGDLLTFSYSQSNFLCIVCKNKRTSTGSFVSTRGNRLLSCYRVDHLSMDTLKIILNVLNKYDNIRSSISYEKSLSGFLGLVGGADKYRTFNVQSIFSLKKVSVQELDPRSTIE